MEKFIPQNRHDIDAGRGPVQDPAGHKGPVAGSIFFLREKTCFEGFKRCTVLIHIDSQFMFSGFQLYSKPHHEHSETRNGDN